MPCALLSVYNKEGIVEFAQELLGLGWSIIASGGTAKALRQANIEVQDVAELVGGEAILGHRVVTLSREIHAGLLSRVGVDDDEMLSLGLPYIDLVCVDLYPLHEAIHAAGNSLDSVIEMTDIGGPTMVRSAAKGNRIIICDPSDRARVLQWIKDDQPDRDNFVNGLAAKAESVVANYCLESARYRSDGNFDGVLGRKIRDCCYGENRWQSPAALFSTDSADPLSLERFELVAGSEPSYVNWRDLDRLLQTMTHIASVFDKNYRRVPEIALGCKHGNACGAAIGLNDLDVTRRMASGDPLALFGGMVMTNFVIDWCVAETMLTYQEKRVLDGVIAPGFSQAAIEVLKRKNGRCRLYVNPGLGLLTEYCVNQASIFMPVRGGFLRQPNYTFLLDLSDPQLVKSDLVSIATTESLLLAWAVGSTSNSNTVTLVKDGTLIGNGVGQQDRVGCCDLALRRARRSWHDINGAVAYSDSFFPFTDGPELLADAGVKAILTSSGSVKDQEVRDFCEKNDVVLWMLPDATARGFFGH